MDMTVMKSHWISSFIILVLQIVSAWVKKEKLSRALVDPEVGQFLVNTYIVNGAEPAPVRLVFMTTPASASSSVYNTHEQAFHFEIDLTTTRAQNQPYDVRNPLTGAVYGKRNYFNEQVTHAAHLVHEGCGYIACVNFEQPRILLLKDDVFRETIFSTPQHEVL
jgi:hypothetical protein